MNVGSGILSKLDKKLVTFDSPGMCVTVYPAWVKDQFVILIYQSIQNISRCPGTLWTYCILLFQRSSYNFASLFNSFFFLSVNSLALKKSYLVWIVNPNTCYFHHRPTKLNITMSYWCQYISFIGTRDKTNL